MLDLGFATLYERQYPPSRHMPRHEHPFTKLSFVLAGSLSERVGRSEHETGAWHVVVKPAGVLHSDRIGPKGARIFSVQLDRGFVSELGQKRAGLEAYRWLYGARFAKAALRAFRAFRAPDLPKDEAALLLLAALPHPETEDSQRPGWLDEACELLHDGFAQPLTVSEVAAHAGVHPVHLMRAFRRHLGCTVGAYLRRLRLQEAATRVALERETPLARIALDAGFADQPHLTRLFRATGGVTPSRYRRLFR